MRWKRICRPARTDSTSRFSDERKLLLETGGGMVQRRAADRRRSVPGVNSDNFWVDGPADTLHLLASLWGEAKMDALLLLVPQARAGNHRGQGDFHMTRDGRLRRRGKAQGRAVRFYRHPDGLEAAAADAPEGPFSTNILWDRAIAEGRCFGAVHQGLWFDVGNPAAIKATERA